MLPVNVVKSEGLSGQLIKTSPKEFIVITIAGSLLAGAAGYVNATTLLGVTELDDAGTKISFTTSHMTGTSTVGSISLGMVHFEDFAVRLCLIVSFAMGSFLVGSFSNPASASWEIGPEYGPLFFLLSLILATACLVAFVNETSFVYYYLVAMAMGLQNALSSKYSGSLIRTTHVTGSLTDIGLILGQLVRGVTKDLWKLPVLSSLVCSFALGCVLAVSASGHKLSISVISIFYFMVAVMVQVFISYSRRQALWSVFVGSWVLGASSDKDDASLLPSVVINPVHDLHGKGHYDALDDNSPVTGLHDSLDDNSPVMGLHDTFEDKSPVTV